MYTNQPAAILDWDQTVYSPRTIGFQGDFILHPCAVERTDYVPTFTLFTLTTAIHGDLQDLAEIE